MNDTNPGDILLGKYRVEETIGIGGMGRVIKANHLYLQQPVAIKILLPQMAESQSTVARFLREAQATVRLRSEHIARVMDVGTMHDGTPFMVMEYLEGHDLNQILRHHGPQLPGAVVDLVLQACEGMAEAHAMGIIHRDIKPSNFFITRRPDGSNLLKILDFGISKTPAEVSELTGTQTVIGTPTYMAPEQMVSARSTDPRSDIWSIGVVMYQLLAGRPPFEAETYAQLVLKVGTDAPAPLHVPLPPGLQGIVLRCLEKDPKNRIQNVGELARMLAPFASDPLSAQQTAERASRILAGPRGSQPGFPLAGGGGPGGGLHLTPQALTPKSWNQNNSTSMSGSAGQIASQFHGFNRKPERNNRSLVIGGVAALCVLAGVGGFLVSNGLKGNARPAAATSPAPADDTSEMTPTTTPTTPTTATTTPTTAAGTPATTTTTPTTPTTTTPVPTVPTITTKTEPAKTEPKAADKTETKTADKTETKTAATKTTAKTETKSTKTASTKSTKSTATKSTATKSTSTKSTTKTTKTKSKSGGDDLFDDRR